MQSGESFTYEYNVLKVSLYGFEIMDSITYDIISFYMSDEISYSLLKRLLSDYIGKIIYEGHCKEYIDYIWNRECIRGINEVFFNKIMEIVPLHRPISEYIEFVSHIRDLQYDDKSLKLIYDPFYVMVRILNIIFNSKLDKVNFIMTFMNVHNSPIDENDYKAKFMKPCVFSHIYEKVCYLIDITGKFEDSDIIKFANIEISNIYRYDMYSSKFNERFDGDYIRSEMEGMYITASMKINNLKNFYEEKTIGEIIDNIIKWEKICERITRTVDDQKVIIEKSSFKLTFNDFMIICHLLTDFKSLDNVSFIVSFFIIRKAAVSYISDKVEDRIEISHRDFIRDIAEKCFIDIKLQTNFKDPDISGIYLNKKKLIVKNIDMMSKYYMVVDCGLYFQFVDCNFDEYGKGKKKISGCVACFKDGNCIPLKE